MATKQVNIDIIAKDKTRQAMKSATVGLNNLKQSVFNLQNALVGLGAGLVAKSFIDQCFLHLNVTQLHYQCC